jgi:CheY-like chemotaxis protein
MKLLCFWCYLADFLPTSYEILMAAITVWQVRWEGNYLHGAHMSPFLEAYLKAAMFNGPRSTSNYLPETLRREPFFVVVDDNELIAQTMADELKLVGYKAEAVMDGDAVYSLLEKSIPDVMLLDYFLPHTTGAELIEEVRADKDFSDVTFMLMSAYPQAEDKAAALGVTFLEKPFGVDQLLRVVEDQEKQKHIKHQRLIPAVRQSKTAYRRGAGWDDLKALFEGPVE